MAKSKSLMKRLEEQGKKPSALGRFDMFEGGRRAIKRTVKKGKKQGLSFGRSPAKILGVKKPKGKMYR